MQLCCTTLAAVLLAVLSSAGAVIGGATQATVICSPAAPTTQAVALVALLAKPTNREADCGIPVGGFFTDEQAADSGLRPMVTRRSLLLNIS